MMNREKDIQFTSAGTNINEVKQKMQRQDYPIMK